MKLDHLVLMLGDLRASLPYYAALLPLLGFTRTRAHVYRSEDGLAIELAQAGAPDRGYAREGVGLNHLGFTAPERGTVAEIRERMAEAGFAVPEIQTFGEDVAIFMKDPDGIRIEVTWYAGAEPAA